jgi:hypothetical protein
MIFPFFLRPYSVLLTFFLASVAGISQEAGSVKSMPPVKIQPPERVKWTIRYESVKQDKAPEVTAEEALAEDGNSAADVVEGQYEIHGKTGHAVLEKADGSKEEMYLFDGMVLFEDAALDRVRVHKIDQYSGDAMRFGQFFPGMNWVQVQYFKGLVEKDGVNCYWFRQEKGTGEKINRPTDPLVYDKNQALTTREAWFAVDTLVPVAFRDGLVMGRYRFAAPPEKPLALPKRHEHAVRYYLGLESDPRPGE